MESVWASGARPEGGRMMSGLQILGSPLPTTTEKAAASAAGARPMRRAQSLRVQGAAREADKGLDKLLPHRSMSLAGPARKTTDLSAWIEKVDKACVSEAFGGAGEEGTTCFDSEEVRSMCILNEERSRTASACSSLCGAESVCGGGLLSHGSSFTLQNGSVCSSREPPLSSEGTADEPATRSPPRRRTGEGCVDERVSRVACLAALDSVLRAPESALGERGTAIHMHSEDFTLKPPPAPLPSLVKGGIVQRRGGGVGEGASPAPPGPGGCYEEIVRVRARLEQAGGRAGGRR